MASGDIHEEKCSENLQIPELLISPETIYQKISYKINKL